MSIAKEGCRAVPRGVWALGPVSMFMDISSEMVHSILPLFLVTLGASPLLIGVIEGISKQIVSACPIIECYRTLIVVELGRYSSNIASLG